MIYTKDKKKISNKAGFRIVEYVYSICVAVGRPIPPKSLISTRTLRLEEICIKDKKVGKDDKLLIEQLIERLNARKPIPLPLVARCSLNLIAGHHCVLAMKKLGFRETVAIEIP